MRVHHRFVPEPPLGVRSHEARLDRTGPDQRDLHHQIVEVVGLGVEDRVHLRAALDLKRADRFAALNQVVRLRVRIVDLVHLGSRTRVLLDHVERDPHHRQRAQS